MFSRLRVGRCENNASVSAGALKRVVRPRLAIQPTRNITNDSRSDPKVIFSGIQPTGVPHLGNYLGALQQWVKLQNEAEHDTTLIYSLVDLHAITLRQDANQLRQWKKESLAMLLAVGLDPKRSIIFHQSDVPAHAELMWILSCQASTGYLSRMTQWKEKTANERENSERLKLGLFSYPVLQAADVLVHQATHVPVGHDQAQHLEFAREIATGFNHVHGEDILVAPRTIISPAKRIMSLTDPIVKMSKSHQNAKSRISLTDSEDMVRNKIKAAVTDSLGAPTYDPTERPGVSNLLDILCHCQNGSSSTTLQNLAKEHTMRSLKELKDSVATQVEATIRPIRERYEHLIDDEKLLKTVAEDGAERARQNAASTLLKVKAGCWTIIAAHPGACCHAVIEDTLRCSYPCTLHTRDLIATQKVQRPLHQPSSASC